MSRTVRVWSGAGILARMSERNVALIRKLYERWARGEIMVAGFFDPEIEFARIGADTPDLEGRWRGLDAFTSATLEYIRALSDLRIEAERIIDLGDDRVLVLSHHKARGRLSGVPTEHELGDLFALRDGSILRYESYWDRAEALAAVGLSA